MTSDPAFERLIRNELTRRQFIRRLGIGGSALAMPSVLVSILAGCSQQQGAAEGTASSPSQGSASSPPQEGWSFTDDRQVTVNLESMPTRIIAQEDSAAALWSFGVRPIATFGNAPLADNPNFEGEDISAVESVGEIYGEIDLEKMAALRPDLLVTTMWPGQGSSDGGWSSQRQADLVGRIAPTVSIAANVPYTRMIDRFAELAEALGADPDAPEMKESRQQLDSALASLRAAVEAKPDLQVLAAAAYAGSTFYVANPPLYSDLMVFETLGLNLVHPPLEAVAESDGYWEELSWENVDKYPADIILLDARAAGLPADELVPQQPTFARLPAVEAGQTGEWFVGTMYRLPIFVQSVEDLTALVERSKQVV
jgi:iron complex transport system substrate-binding protein